MSYFKIFNQRMVNRKIYIPFPLIDIYYFQWNKMNPLPIHDHAEGGCVMMLLKGKLKEKRYDKNIKLIKENTYYSPKISFINNDIGYHSIKPEVISRSIHFYYPKNHKTKYFNSNKDEINSIYNTD
tara:strand:+ start:367 stop:744 length:378 start_codon:yes stop_codon:yes gene_type:complete